MSFITVLKLYEISSQLPDKNKPELLKKGKKEEKLRPTQNGISALHQVLPDL